MQEHDTLPQSRFIWAFTDKFELCGKIQKQTSRDWTLGRKVNVNTLHKNYGHIISDHDKTIANYLIQTFPHEREVFRLSHPLLTLLHSANNLFNDAGEPISLTLHPILLVFKVFKDKIAIEKYPDEKSDAYVDELKLLRQHTQNGFFFESHPPETLRFLTMLKKVPVISTEAMYSLIQKIANRINWVNELDHQYNIDINTLEKYPHVWLKFSRDTVTLSITHQTEDNTLQLPSGFGDAWHYMGQDKWVKRELSQEQHSVKKILALLGIKKQVPTQEYLLELNQVEKILPMLESLPEIKIHWLKNQARIIKADVKDLTFSMNTIGNALKLQGVFTLDDDEVITLQQMLQARRQGYIELNNGESRLEFTQSLNQQLALLSHLLDEDSLIKNQVSPMIAHLDHNIRSLPEPNWQSKLKAWDTPIVIDENTLAGLRSYQQEGVKWAIQLIHYGFGACLADDMGLGKTLQALKVISHFSSQGPSLVICPKSVLFNWQQEATKFTPGLNVTIFETLTDKSAFLDSPLLPNSLLIMGYSQLPLYLEFLQSIPWQMLVIDEAQQIKNPGSQRTKALVSLNAKGKMALSGTPVENNIFDLWSLFHFLNPELLGSQRTFKEHYSRVAKEEDPLAELRFLVSPFILRRLKRDVLNELPEKIEINHSIELSPKERAAYETVRLDILNKKTHSSLDILAGITRLRQICSDASLVFDHFTTPSSKLLNTIKIIEGALAGGHKILIFSQFVGLLNHLKQLLKEQKISFSYLDGQTPLKQRAEEIEHFKNGPHDLFLISLKAGGTGLNLTEADTVIHLDPWWNPAVEDQASDRAYRIGQTQTVTVYRLIAKDTIEEHIIELHHAKRQLALQILETKEVAEEIDPDFLLSLLTRHSILEGSS